MKALKLVVVSIFIYSGLFVAGCNDNFTSPEISNSGVNQRINPEGNYRQGFYTATITLEPAGFVFLNSELTSLERLNSYSISNCRDDRRKLFISTSSTEPPGSMDCNWKTSNGFMIEDLLIENISGEVITFDVVLTGTPVNGEFLSPFNSQISDKEKVNSDELHIDSALHRTIRLKPHQTYSFTYLNTGFRVFRSITAPNCEELENIIEIRGYADDGEVFIECGSNNFAVFEINIRNLTSGFVDLDLTLTGSRKLVNPKHLSY